eukprot:CAMPEP_0176129932 /NCGR_PEP_ID=MMETSP0120_2-20121206/65723_1 /TAXON_ID=160619 /ORGANISM="Kryptoperidinium foliaceum, Strain CCMP 1326" /LENGTH=248 /DNA_ID=CAMNT_0017465179 /DNA_START=191 /DNA_END=934 /DNA_ORIENTATION=-
MANDDDMDAILEQALDDLEQVQTVEADTDDENDEEDVPSQSLDSRKPHGSTPRTKKSSQSGSDDNSPLDPEAFFRHLIENDDDLADDEKDAQLDAFMKELQQNSPQKTTGTTPVGDNRLPTASEAKDEVEATLAAILQQMTTIEQGDESGDDFPTGDLDLDPDAIVDGMMEQLLSKDLMYEPMKQVADRFPAWLEEKEGHLSESEMQRYQEQYQCFKDLVEQYENDSSDMESLIDLMQRVQEFGQPPP